MQSTSIATLAQSVERLTRNEQVVSSILTSGSTTLDGFARLGFCISAGRSVRHARVAELVDAQDLGSCVFDVWVQVPSRALSQTAIYRPYTAIFQHRISFLPTLCPHLGTYREHAAVIVPRGCRHCPPPRAMEAMENPVRFFPPVPQVAD